MSESDDADPYQVMPELDEDEYARLKEDIRENGLEYPIILDGNGEIIDGHHRYQAWVDLGRDPDDLPTRVVDDTDDENYHRAYRANLLRRDLSDGTKRRVVKQYLVEHPERVAEDTQAAIASDLGVSEWLVSQVANDPDVKELVPKSLSTDEKRQQVREFVEDNPEASNREVAREVECDVTHVTVGNWRDEWDIQEPTTGLDTFTNTKSEAESVMDVVETATDSEVDEEVRETAQERAEDLTSGTTTPEEAQSDVEQAETEVKERREKEERRKNRLERFTNEDETVRVFEGDADQVVYSQLPAESVNHIVTDPPYTADAVESGVWRTLAEIADYALEPSGFVIAYGSKVHLQEALEGLGSKLEYYWQLVLRHSGPGAKIWSRDIRTGYKPILVFQKPPVETQEEFITDVIEGSGREKDSHEWQQAESESAELLERFTNVDDEILDPFAGSGTVGVACKRLNRRCVLIDRDPDAIDEIERRVIK